MRGPRRILLFCLLTAVLPTILLVIPLYTRHIIFADVLYSVSESDIVEIVDGVSSIFCQEHSLRMNSSFQAFQVKGKPRRSGQRKHVRLLKRMTLPDDTLEYWGFFLMQGSTVEVSLCSRFAGSRILVVEGERNLRTCGLMEHSEKPLSAHMANGHSNVRVSFDPPPENQTQTTPENSVEVENDEEEDLKLLEKLTKDFIDRHRSQNNTSQVKETNVKEEAMNGNETTKESRRKRRDILEKSLHAPRIKRYLQLKEGHVLDAKVGHGHAGNETERDGITDESSVSSFENNLLACYDGKILLVQGFPPTTSCSSHEVLFSKGIMKTTHEVQADGYYYYIFYSDNDIVQNDIHAVFNIFKPTYQFSNITKECINQTECSFPISFWSDDTVIVEVPTHDGIEHDEKDTLLLVSSCHPRMAVYIIFPVSVLFLILMCAFL